MAGERVAVARYAKHPTDALAGAASVAIAPGTVEKVDQGAAAATGRADGIVADKSLGVDVMGLETMYHLTSATFDAVDVADVVYARITPRTVHMTDPGPGDCPGPAGFLVTDYAVDVELYAEDYSAVLDLVGATAADLVLTVTGAAGAAKTITVKNVYFGGSAGQIEAAARDAGGMITAYGVRGSVNLGANEVFADVITGDATQFAAMLAKIGAAAANLVVGIKHIDGTNEKLTLKNVRFVEPGGPLELPRKDVAGNLTPFGIRGMCEWGAADTFATMMVAAADA